MVADKPLGVLVHRLAIKADLHPPCKPRVDRQRRPAIDDAIVIGPPGAGKARVPVVGHCHAVENGDRIGPPLRSEEHTSELQSLMRISYAVFCLKKKKKQNNYTNNTRPNTLQRQKHSKQARRNST